MEKPTMYDEGVQVRRRSVVMRVWLVVDYLFWLAYGLIGLEILLDLAGARETSGFKKFLNTITGPLLNPFEGLFADPVFSKNHRFKFSYAIALVVYMLVHLAVYRIFLLVDQQKPE